AAAAQEGPERLDDTAVHDPARIGGQLLRRDRQADASDRGGRPEELPVERGDDRRGRLLLERPAGGRRPVGLRLADRPLLLDGRVRSGAVEGYLRPEEQRPA